jgi:histidine triad (HIT) family protein
MPSDCIFCRIAAAEIPAEIVFSNDHVVAFRDTNPQASTHVLIIPRDHVASAHELPGDDRVLNELFAAMRRIADEEGLENGYRIVTNVGPDAGQTVQHLHFHLLGGRPMGWPPG